MTARTLLLLMAAAVVLNLSAAVCWCSANPPAATETPATTPVELNELEQAFSDLMKDCTLVGRFTVDGAEDRGTRPDRYTIIGVTKVKGDDWLVNARVKYGDFDVVVPVPVKMNWAGDTAVLSVTDLTLPVLGEGFSARLLFSGERYAGTWGHGPVGGHMWGKIEKQAPSEPQAK